FFHILSEADHIFHIISVAYTHHVLFDNRTGIQLLGNIVTSCPYEFHSAGRGLMIRPGTNKGRQEAVVNIDYPTGIFFTETCGQYLHIARQYNTIGLLFIYQSNDFVVGMCLVNGINWDMMDRNTLPLHHTAKIIMIGDYAGNLTVQLAAVESVQQISQAIELATGQLYDFLAFG